MVVRWREAILFAVGHGERASADLPFLFSPGAILGTPGFASPKQLRGQALDVRSDLYSVGATVFYLLTGRAPFDDQSTTALITRVATEPQPSLVTLRPDVPRRAVARDGDVVARDCTAVPVLVMKNSRTITASDAGALILPSLRMALLIAGAVWTALHPSRSIQDRLAGRWIVPR